MPTPITISDPILAAVAEAPGVTTAFLADVVDLINRSPNLLTEINQLDGTKLSNGSTAQIQMQTGQDNGGNTYYHAQTINIAALPSYDDTGVIYSGGSLTAGQTEDITPAGSFVGILAHEIAHWGDVQLNPIYNTGALSTFTLEQAVATEFASEGKAATSQYLAMSQIQASEATNPLPADMVNGNILFDAANVPQADTAQLQHEQTLAAGTTGYAASVSYLGSQFWNVPVNGGDYLTSMWTSYAAGGARDDLGINMSQIAGYQVSEAADGTLAGCTIQTAPASGALTYQITCPVVGEQQAVITNTTSGIQIATVSTTVTTANVQLSVVANGFAFTVLSGAVAAIQGNGDTLTLGSKDSLFLAGSGNSVIGAAGNTVNLGTSTSASVDQGGTVNLNGSAASAIISGTGSTIRMFANNGAVTASGSNVAMSASSNGILNGSNNAVSAAAQSLLTVNGTANTVTGSSAGLVLSSAQTLKVVGNQNTLSLGAGGGASDTVTLSGNHNRLFGGVNATSLHLNLSGTGSVIVLTAGSASINGGGATTTVFGGASDVSYGGGGGILVLGSGKATIGGAAAGAQETVFGGASGLAYQGGREYADVIGGVGAVTINAGSGGGWYGGGSAGGNMLQASGGGTVLDAGGNNDTLVGATGGGTYLIAATGNETLYGGNKSGLSTAFLGSGADRYVAGAGGSIIDTGSGTATVFGGGGHDQVWGGTGGADLYAAGAGGQVEIVGFRTGTDHLSSGSQGVTTVAQSAGGTLFTLSSGATIMLVGVHAQTGSAFA